MFRNLRIALTATTLLAAASGALQAQPARADAGLVFNGVIFEEQLRERLGNRVKGYAFAVSDAQGIEARAAGGWAQDPADGNLRMSSRVPSGIGSVTKMFSSTALLQLFERRALANATVDAQLDTAVWAKLPPKWRSSYPGKGLEAVTYRQLLQHRSGFLGKDCGGELTDIDEMLARGIRAQDVGKRCYSNFNIKLLRFLLPAIAYPADTLALQKEVENLGVKQQTEHLNVAMSHLFERYMRDEFFPRSADRIKASCRPQKDFGARAAAKSYSDRNDNTGAYVKTAAQELEADHFCATQGSWFTSAEDLALFGRNLLHTDSWLSAATRRSLWQPERANDRLPWSGVVSTQRLGTWPEHGGDERDYHAALVMLPNGHVGAGLVNSSEVNSNGVAKALIDAFDAATRGEPVARAWHAMTPATYQQRVGELDESAHRVDWVDFYNVGNKVFVNAVVRPSGAGPKHRVQHNLTAQAYQQAFDRHVKSGQMKLLQVDSYIDQGAVRYAFVMAPGDGRGLPAYHGVDAVTHKRLFDEHTARGFVPTSVSVVVVGGERQYSTSWQRADLGALVVRSTLDGNEYQQLADEMAARKMELIYLNSYTYRNQAHYSAVFAERVDRPQVWRHALSDADYQREFDELTSQGFGLRLVAGVGQGSTHRFAAVWQKPQASRD